MFNYESSSITFNSTCEDNFINEYFFPILDHGMFVFIFYNMKHNNIIITF